MTKIQHFRNDIGVRQTRIVVTLFTACSIILGLAFTFLIKVSAKALVLIWVVALFLIAAIIFAFVVRKETPVSLELRSDGVAARYFMGTSIFEASSIESYEIWIDPLGAGIGLYLANGKQDGLSMISEDLAIRIARHLGELGVTGRPTRYFWKRPPEPEGEVRLKKRID